MLSKTVYPLALLTSITSILIVVISLPPVWNSFYRISVGEELQNYDQGKIYLKDSERISTALWSRDDYAEVSKSLELTSMTIEEQRHFEDVRILLRVALFTALILGMPILVFRKRINWKVTWRYTLVICLFFCAAAGIWTTISWQHMFSTLHWWVFRDDSWLLPWHAYSLYLYPYSIWKSAAIALAMALLIIISSGVILTRKAD